MITALAYAFISSLASLLTLGSEATLLFAGDAMMHKGQLAAAVQPDGEYEYDECFEAIAPMVQSVDYAIVNLETPLGGKPYSGYPCFCAPDSYADALANAGFDLFLTANNHTLDRGDNGLKRTVNVLNSKSIPHVGTYRDEAQRDSLLPLIKEVNGFKIAFLNYTYGTNGIPVRGNVVVDYIDRDKMRRDIAKARKGGAELVCAAMHWGDEYHLLPNAEQRSLADFLVSQGVDLIIGGHPHVIQPMEMRVDSLTGKKTLLVYSLGNFISDMKKTDTRGGAVVKVTLCRDDHGNALVDSAEYDLVFTVPGQPGRNFRLVPAERSAAGEWGAECDAFEASATSIFDKHNIDVPRAKHP